MATTLLSIWLDQLRGREIASLDHERFPRLLEAFTPPDFRIMVAEGSVIRRTGDADVRVELSARIQPLMLRPDAMGNRTIGTIERIIDTASGIAQHRKFELPAGWTDQGRGRATLRANVDLYRALGLSGVHLVAVDVGRYVWAMSGFDFVSHEERGYVLRAAGEFLNALDYDFDPGDIEHPWELGALEGETTLSEVSEAFGEALDLPDGLADKLIAPIRLGKAVFLYGEISGWQGRLDLDVESPGYIEFERYT